MPAFNAPNPYGSYFSFQEPASLASASFLPFMTPGVSPGVAAAMGAPVGGFNPTQEEFQRGRNRDVVYQQFMAKALAEDPRVSSVSNMLLSAMYGNNHAARMDMVKRMGGGNQVNEMVGFAMGMPGVSGFFGGSPRSMALGALGAATGGMRFSGMGFNNQGLFGDSGYSAVAANSILSNVRGRFFSPSGASNLSMTQGLNQDQIGGLMMQGGVQGAFAGLNLGKMDMVKGHASLMADSGTMDKLSKFVKDAAKSISSLIDIYGNSDVASLLNKAKQITGLDITSRMGNAEVFNQRMSRMRDVGMATGIDIQSMADVSSGAVRLGMSYGLSPAGAGAIAHNAAIDSAHRINEYKTTAGNVYLPQMSQGEFAAAATRDAVAMNRDPVGVRRNAMELLGQQGRIPQSVLAGMRDRLNNMGPSQAGINKLDAEMMSSYGISLPGFISSMGGADRVYDNLNENNKLISANNHGIDTARRADFAISKMYRQQNPGMKGGATMLSLVNSIGADNLQNVLQTSDKGGDVRAALMADPEGRRDPEKYLKMINSLDTEAPGSLHGMHQGILQAMHNSSLPFVANHLSQSDRISRASLEADARPKLPDELSAIRGQTHGGFIQGVLEHLDGRDPASIAAIVSSMRPEQVARYRLKKDYDTSTRAGVIDFVRDANVFAEQFRKTDRGIRMLATLGPGIATGKAFPIPGDESYNEQTMMNMKGKLLDPIWQQQNLDAQYKVFSDRNSGEQMAVPRDLATFMETGGTAARTGMLTASASYIEANGGARNAQERAILQSGHMLGRGLQYRIGATGQPIGAGSAVNVKDLNTVNERSGELFNSASRIESFLTRSSDPLNTWLDASYSIDKNLMRTFSQNKEMSVAAMQTIVTREGQLDGHYDSRSLNEKSLLKGIKDALKEAGIAEPVSITTTVTKIQGSLKLDPDTKNLIFGTDSQMTESKVGGSK